MEEFYQHKELTGRIIGSAMQVHNVLGNGFQDVIYQRALAIELTKRGLAFAREVEMPIFYDGEQIGLRRVDFFVQDLNFGRIESRGPFRKGAFGARTELLGGFRHRHRPAH